MFNNKRILAVIPARGGSKGVPRKNIRPLAGKPLLAWTIEEAKKSKYIDKTILSSEDAEIVAVAEKFGCDVPFIRPADLAKDDTPGIAPVLHALDFFPAYEYIVLLQPTSPFRTSDDIDGCIETFFSSGALSCVSVAETAHTPYWMYLLSKNSEMLPLLPSEKEYTRRQDAPPVYALNGAIYVADTESVKKNKTFLQEDVVGYIMSQEHSLDIDSVLDFEFAEFLMTK